MDEFCIKFIKVQHGRPNRLLHKPPPAYEASQAVRFQVATGVTDVLCELSVYVR
jgi:hypothetical protein